MSEPFAAAAKARCSWWTPRRASGAGQIANCYTAVEQGVEVVPVINKIDLPSADAGRVINGSKDIIGIPARMQCSLRQDRAGRHRLPRSGNRPRPAAAG
jgi:hypothetical protein